MLTTINNYLWGKTVLAEPVDKVSFTLNGKRYTIGAHTCPIDTTLNTFLRNHTLLRGTKYMCLEGGCGICTVYVERQDRANGEKESISVNSCLLLVFACHGLEITTIEGIGNRKDGYHPLQKQLAEFNGSQCGMCSPGMVMTMYGLMKSKHGKVSAEEVENAFGGNLCRCTGYRPILEAFRTFATSSEQLCEDIEDFVKICPGECTKCVSNCKVRDDKRPVRILFLDGREWHRVYTLQEVLNILKQIGDRPYMLVCGNTAHGVYRRNENVQVFIDINSVVELHEVSISDTISVGANITLTKFIDVLTDAAAQGPQYYYCKEMIKHIELVAHPLVRNVGSIAGNLSLKNQHCEFPSDISLLLEAVGAKLTIMNKFGQKNVESIVDYISSSAQKKVIRSISLPALDPNVYVFKTFKIMPRAQNAFALMNAAFLLKFDASKTITEEARICFGNISANFTRAEETERFLVGKTVFSNDSLQAVIKSLNAELQPDWILPESSAEYRKNLAIALFYKLVLGIAPVDQVRPQFRSGATVLERPLSSSKHSFDTYKKYWPLTKFIPKVEGLSQCAGEAEYINDIPPFPNELFAAFVVATVPRSKVAEINPSEALKTEGVVGCFTAKDIPGANSFTPQVLEFPEVEEILCSGKVLYYGQPVGIVVAETSEIAYKAAKLVEVTYEKGSNQVIRLKTSDGEVSSKTFKTVGEEYDTTGIRDTNKIIGRIELFGQSHFPLEKQTCICVPQESGLDVYPSAQWMGVTQVAIAQMLNVPQSRINIFIRRLGGAFGSKVSRQGLTACGAALAAHLTNRPVRFNLTLEADMQLIGKRCGCISDYEVHVDNNGRILRLINYFAHNFGSSFNEPLAKSVILLFPNCYDNKYWTVVGKMVKTDLPKNTWCRAPASTEAIAMVETIMENIAHATGKDPLEVRLANIPKDSKMRLLIPEFLKQIDFDSRRKFIDLFNVENRWKKRGIAWIPMKFQTDFHGIYYAFVSINIGDGSVVVTHGGIEMGQGINTKVTQVIASTLGIELDMVSVKASNTWTAANSEPSVASITSESVCYAANEACKTLLERMKPYRQKYPDASWFQLVQICYVASVDLSVSFMFKATDVLPYFIWSLCSAEVEIDVLTGNILIRRMDVQNDTGESMSPGIDLGQVEGAIVMGLGYHLAEELIYDATNGKLLTDRTVNYKLFGAKDIPVDFRVNFLKGSSNPCGVLRSKSTSEPPLNLSVVVLFALRYALRSSRRDAGLPDNWIPLTTATTPEKIFLKSGNKMEDFLIN
ncbi:AAEL006163-PA [Aedes aegypti]|uniref:Indole-3-acetaldehyde oxidase n=1 Tax=Aedes aegypti TaxID=7159 RepID=Q177D7_AEDAE|nr:AAEL006163-PA [Aedes aegypti]